MWIPNRRSEKLALSTCDDDAEIILEAVAKESIGMPSSASPLWFLFCIATVQGRQLAGVIRTEKRDHNGTKVQAVA